MDRRAESDLGRAREHFVDRGAVDARSVVRPEIVDSWERSRRAGVDATQLALPYEPDLDFDGSLANCARPVLDDLAERLSGMSVAVVLTDADGRVLERRVGEGELQRRLDAISLAPGFSYAEEFAGTNGVGTALEGAMPALVVGAEHFSERLQGFACAGAPVRGPDGGLAGILDVTCLRAEANDLMRFLAQQAATDIEDVLRERGGAGLRRLMAAFRSTCGRSRGPVFALTDDLVMANRAARVLSGADQERIAVRAVERGHPARPRQDRVLLADGPARLMITPVPAGRPAGVVVEVVRSRSSLRLAGGDDAPPALLSVPAGGHEPPAQDRPLPGLAGTSRPWRTAAAGLRAAAGSGRSTVVVGEPGTGKTVAVRAVHGEVRPTARWITVDGADPDAAVVLAGYAAEASGTHGRAGPAGPAGAGGPGPATVVVRHAEALDAAGAGALTALLGEVPSTWWVVGLVSGERAPEDGPVGAVLSGFATSVVIEPLRRRPDDVPLLAAALLARLAPARRARCTAETTALLAGARWPGNVTQLADVLRRALAARPAGDIEPSDLPAEFAVHGTRRRLTPLEAAERDLIVSALLEAGGNRSAAAAALGMGRATLYRRLRAFGITDVGR
ncbi:sigma-54-dependent Fis family transcriptional regulator [Actinomycetospora cinnamomea]|uniref:Transcriptional regulator of acetoin/glycerol metabolism n=1 Tax=Actinomycetospora cinnamomea TaxID=663609 RepID=A0A2U1FCK6_9PSEU|nr:helix-turn-helix domain-containing protein [Actinomycetospora cinnamomea]PVZ09933.1 transcriptional regulator of acetoin/glycerol metabolism [Actinomycetospora cinnamomea]